MSELTPGSGISQTPDPSQDHLVQGQPSRVEPRQIGRNEPCPCGSGRKYKRCHGVGAAPKMTPPKPRSDELGADGQSQTPGFPQLNPEMLAQLDPSRMQMPPGMEGVSPEMMSQVARMLQRLPKGQLQRLQAIMQKAMAGKDVTQEAQEFERTLPQEFQQMLSGFQMPALAGFPGAPAGGSGQPIEVASESVPSEMTPEQAREIVARAAAEGKISSEQAAALLGASSPSSGSLPGPSAGKPGGSS